MLPRLIRIFVIASLVFAGVLYCTAQQADNTSPIFSTSSEDEKNRPRSIKESLEKMRIDKEKKEHGEMIERGQEALRISEQLETAFSKNGKLSEKEIAKVADVEKIVKKIRNELGGDDDSSEDKKEEVRSQTRSLSPADAIKSLRSTTITLFNELKKTTRFSISAAAIQSSNAVLKIARFLRITN